MDSHELRPLIRKKVGDFLYAYGSFPDDDFEQAEGYRTDFFAPPNEVEEGVGDRYRTVVVISAEKIVPVFLDLCQLLSPRVRVVLERASEDVYVDRDVFVSDLEIDREDFVEVFKAYEFTFAEDGMLGIGAFSPEASVEIFLTDHKEIVIFSREQDSVPAVLQRHGLRAMDLEFYYERSHQHVALTEYRGLRGAQFDYYHVVDALRQVFSMSQQLDEDQNLDERGNPLGLVPWRAMVVVSPRRRARASRRGQRSFGQEFLLTAENRREARELLEARLERDGYALVKMSELFRFDLSTLPQNVVPKANVLQKPWIWFVGDRTETPDPGWH